MDKRARRVRINKVGRILGVDCKYLKACIILDLSETGALLLVHGKPPPDDIRLFQRSNRTLRKATVVRRGPMAIAVHFTSTAEHLTADDFRLKHCLD